MRRLLPLTLVICVVGCVDRSFTLQTEPPGATVLVDGEEKGKTPVTIPFTWYGTREFRFELEGFETLVVKEEVKAPTYQYPVLDFVTDVIWPATIKDHKTFSYTLGKQKEAEKTGLLQRAGELRDEVKKWPTPPPQPKPPKNPPPKDEK